MNENENFVPQCVYGLHRDDGRENLPLTAYNNNGYLLPCCLVEGVEFHPVFSKFLDPALRVEDNESIDDIVTSDTWVDFFYNIINNKTVPSICLEKCSRECK